MTGVSIRFPLFPRLRISDSIRRREPQCDQLPHSVTILSLDRREASPETATKCRRQEQTCGRENLDFCRTLKTIRWPAPPPVPQAKGVGRLPGERDMKRTTLS